MKNLVLFVLFFPVVCNAQFSVKDLFAREDQVEVTVLDENLDEEKSKLMKERSVIFADFVKKAVLHFEIKDNINIIVRREDEKHHANIFVLPSLDPDKKLYGIYVNPSALLNVDDSIEHVAYHEVCHIVVDRQFSKILDGAVEIVDDVELRVERQVYFFVGARKYMKFLAVNTNLPDLDDEKSAEHYKKILEEMFGTPP